MAEKKKRRVRNTFDHNTGLPVMINLLIIRTIYYGMKNKANIFVEEDMGRKKKYIPVYCENILNISRSRYDRLQRGASFEISNREANDLSALFNIDIRYFRRDTPDAFDLENISMLDWKCYYIDTHEIDYNVHGKVSPNRIKERADVVRKELQNLANKEWSAEEDDKNPIFYIWYYFRTGKKYEKINPAVKCVIELQKVQLEEWDCLFGNMELEQYKSVLKRHYEYVDALVTIKNLKKYK